jgi:hypothetical protein
MVQIKMWIKKVSAALALAVLLASSLLAPVAAVCDPGLQSCSNNWGVGETFWGNGGELNACSTAYCTKQTAGELALGNTYANTVLRDTPVGYWKLDETSGTVAADSSGNSRNGTYSGTYTQGQPGLTGNSGTSTYFNGGATSYVSIPSNADFRFTTNNQITVEFWYKGTQVGSGGGQPTGLFTSNVDASNKQWIVGIDSTGHVQAQNIRFQGIYGDTISVSTINDDKRHHVVVNYNVTTLKVDIYIDGILDKSGTAPSWDNFGSPALRIANNPRSNSAAATIDDAAIYKTNLTPTQIAQHYSSGTLGYQANAGFNTDRTEYLEFQVNSASVNLGTLTTGTTGTGTATFSVKSYLANGYQVVNASVPPKNGSYTIAGLNSQAASSPGTEQFGINLASNTSPATFGSDPIQVPSGTFSYGDAATGYDTPNVYRYVNGDVVAESSRSTGETDYTISYIMNISNATPGGTYTMSHVLVATSTF